MEPNPASHEYTTVFDFADQGFDGWSAILMGLVGMAMSFALLLVRGRTARPGSRWSRVLAPAAMLVFATSWTVLVAFGASARYWSLSRAFERGDFEVVEGRIEDFVPQAKDGKARSGSPVETFTVDGTTFEYSWFHTTPAFHHTQAHGGPLREGLQVRIAHREGVILKLEMVE